MLGCAHTAFFSCITPRYLEGSSTSPSCWPMFVKVVWWGQLHFGYCSWYILCARRPLPPAGPWIRTVRAIWHVVSEWSWILVNSAMPNNKYLLLFSAYAWKICTRECFIFSIAVWPLSTGLSVLRRQFLRFLSTKRGLRLLCSMGIFHHRHAYFHLSEFVCRIRRHPVNRVCTTETYSTWCVIPLCRTAGFPFSYIF